MITMSIVGLSLITLYKLQDKGKLSVNDTMIKIVLVGISCFYGWELIQLARGAIIILIG